MRQGPLAGVKVLELAQIMAGPTCGMMLADLGADVIKVERVPGGDDTRRMDRPSVNGESASFMAMNRNKRGIALNLKLPAAQEALKRMAARADVVTENYRQGTMEKLGVGYESLRENQSRDHLLLHLRLRPHRPLRRQGRLRPHRAGHVGPDGRHRRAGRAPAKSGGPVCDINAGMLGALGVVSAYVHRLKTGEGQLVETSLFEAGIQQMYWQAAIYFATGEVAGPTGSAHILSAPYQAFRAADGWLNIGGANQANWERMCRVLGASDWLEDARFRTNADRMKNLGALTEVMNARLKSRKVDELIKTLEAEGVPCGRDQFDRRGGGRPAGACARNGGRARTSARRAHARARAAGEAVAHTRQGLTPGAAARAAHARSVGGVRLLARRDRRAGTERSRSRWLISSPHNDRRST